MNGEFELHALDGYIETLYLAVYEDKILVLDCGCSGDARKIVSYVERELGRSTGSIRLAVASHAHPDHMGGAGILQRKYGIKVAAPPLINSWYPGLTGWVQRVIDTVLSQYVALCGHKRLESTWFGGNLDHDFALQDERPLPFFDDWTVLDAPGHTNHDVVLYNENARLLYAADLIVKLGSSYSLPIPVTFGRQMGSSLERIGRLEVRRLALAHAGIQDVDGIQGVVECLKQQVEPGARRGLVRRIAGVLQSFSPAARRPPRSPS